LNPDFKHEVVTDVAAAELFNSFLLASQLSPKLMTPIRSLCVKPTSFAI
jgi:hypothetical protein